MQSLNQDENLCELGSFKIIQTKNGYRFTEDSVALADFVLPLESADSVIDLGTGSGVIPLLLAQKSPVGKIVGVEIQEGMARLAERNVELNGLSARISIINADIRDRSRMEHSFRGAFSVVVSNPPYAKLLSGRVSPHSERARARMELDCEMMDVVKAAKWLAKKSGRVAFCYPVGRLSELLSAAGEHELYPSRLQFIYPGQISHAKSFLIEFQNEG